MPEKSHTPTEIIQNIIQDDIQEDLKFDPSSPRRFFITNIFSRALAHLIGWTGQKSVRLTATAAGILKVAPTGAGFQYNDTKAGSAADAYGAPLAFDTIVSRVDLYIWDNSAIIKKTLDGVLYQDEIEIPPNVFFSFDCNVHSINIKNKTALAVARYQIVGWY